MPADGDYASVSRGGLKLKGVQNARVDKPKKKHKKDKKEHRPKEEIEDNANEEKDGEVARTDDGSPAPRGDEDPATRKSEDDPGASPPASSRLKTEAERRHEERRRKRLDDRLKREGTKTHKERVEDLNRYLSSLTEHHDMPRIGPG